MSDIDELQELRSLNRKHATETTSIHNDMLALAELVGVHYDGVSSPSGFLHGDIMPAVQRLEESRVIAEHLYKLTRAEKQVLARRNNDLKLALHTAQQDLQRLASPTRFSSRRVGSGTSPPSSVRYGRERASDGSPARPPGPGGGMSVEADKAAQRLREAGVRVRQPRTKRIPPAIPIPGLSEALRAPQQPMSEESGE